MIKRDLGTWRRRLTVSAAACVGVLALTQCKSDSTAPGKVAAANVVAPISTSTVAAVSGQTFTFPGGGAALSPALAGQTISLTFSNTTAANPTTTVTSAAGSFTASTSFGSCIFTVSTSTIPGITVGQVITVNPCQLNVQTGGVQATGQATTVNILLQLGLTPSAPQQSQVTINPTTGTVTVNGVNTGTVTLTPVTGGA